MSKASAANLQSKIETASRKHKYKELIEKGSRVSEFNLIYQKYKFLKIFISVRFKTQFCPLY